VTTKKFADIDSFIVNTNACQVCYESFSSSSPPSPDPSTSISPSAVSSSCKPYYFSCCNHVICLNCITHYYNQIDLPVSHNEGQEKCPLCPARKDLIDSSLWDYAYSNIQEWCFQLSLFPKRSSVWNHYLSLAKEEYNRLLCMISSFPRDLHPLQYDLLKLKILSFEEDNLDKQRERVSLAKSLLTREIKDFSNKITIYKELIIASSILKEYMLSKNICSDFFRYLRALLNEIQEKRDKEDEIAEENQDKITEGAIINENQKGKRSCITFSQFVQSLPAKCQQDISDIHSVFLDVLLRLEEYDDAVALGTELMHKNRHRANIYLQLANGYIGTNSWEMVVWAMKLGSRYMISSLETEEKVEEFHTAYSECIQMAYENHYFS
jgi:hypothetical protein